MMNESHRGNRGNGCAYVPNYCSTTVAMPYIDDELVPVFTKDDLNPRTTPKTNSYKSFTGSFYDNVPLWDSQGFTTLPRNPSTGTRNSTRTLPAPVMVNDEDGKPVLVCYMRTRSLIDLVRSTRRVRRKTFTCDRKRPRQPITKRYSWDDSEVKTVVTDNDSNTDTEGATWV